MTKDGNISLRDDYVFMYGDNMAIFLDNDDMLLKIFPRNDKKAMKY